MFNFCSLYSGSSGNSLFVETENTKLLIDAGVSSKKIETALTNLEVDPSTIDGILITHEHSDHVKGLKVFTKKHKARVFMTAGTYEALAKTDALDNVSVSFEAGKNLETPELDNAVRGNNYLDEVDEHLL